MTLRNLIAQLKDAHTILEIDCYNKILFTQSLSLYSVVTPNNQQKIKIMDDFLNSSNNNCEVTKINGQNALETIIKFAKEQVSDSRDLGVRFNQALASLTMQFGRWLVSEGSNQFAHRFDLPETSNISYTLLCSGEQRHLVRKWDINFQGQSTDFNDTKSYFDQNCLPNSSQSAKNNTSLRLISESTFNRTTTSHSDNQATTSQSDDQATTSQPEPVLDAKNAHFYLIGNIGVAQFTSVNFGFDTLRNIQKGFQLLFKKKAKKLVIDLSNNPGGVVDAAQVICFLLIPPNNISFFPNDIKITKITEPLIGPGKYFDPNVLSSFPSGNNFSSIKNFIGKNYIKRGGKTSRYSNKFDFTLDRDELKLIKNNKEYPWTGNNTIILTNGNCGSACALISQYLAEIGQFPTVTVGGLYNTSLSFASFSGGEVFGYDGSEKFKGIPSFPVSGELQFTVSESYSILKKNEVLDFSYRPSKYRLYYDDKSARDPSLLWSKAADFLNFES
ncbi:356_t:CDS:2 [Dentiscutata heterogama]|uniref:356_t:CDS:1 n=1 Tax=Dentiscutata heterogama TaxID=1316150 RepID=A0ACA9LM07_9GLOM|nr:356_t:CDS:2 [Dentiscutata heterogama]